MNILRKLFFQVKGFLFPAVCTLCENSLITSSEIKYGLCLKCCEALLPEEKNRCNLCGKPLVSEKEICIPCRNGQNHSYDRLWVIFPYTGKYRTLLKQYKFSKNLSLADFFAEKILEIIYENPVLKDAVIIPVPPRPGKIKNSGWDQVEYLLKRLKKISKPCISVFRCLKRKKSKIQKRLDRTERLKNLKGRIFMQGNAPKIALIIDDVITTGSTMEVCASVLKENGAQEVYGLCLFYD